MFHEGIVMFQSCTWALIQYKYVVLSYSIGYWIVETAVRSSCLRSRNDLPREHQITLDLLKCEV